MIARRLEKRAALRFSEPGRDPGAAGRASGWGTKRVPVSPRHARLHRLAPFPASKTCVSVMGSNSAWAEWSRRGFYLAEKLHRWVLIFFFPQTCTTNLIRLCGFCWCSFFVWGFFCCFFF